MNNVTLVDKREISFEEHKALQLEILKRVRDFCNQHGLQYYLSDGTLLGAIRHDGFIPWDDDIDIEMPRPDYNKLAEIFVDQPGLELVRPEDAKSRFHHIKICDTRTVKIESGVKYNNDYLGVDIDIFTIDGSPTDQEEYEQIRKEINKLYRQNSLIRCGFIGSIKHRLKVAAYRVLYGSPDALIQKAVSLCEKYAYDSSEYATRYGRYSLGYRVEKSCYTQALKEFEGEQFSIPAGYDTILKKIYGDYMQLPPEEERVTHHSNKVYWIEKTED